MIKRKNAFVIGICLLIASIPAILLYAPLSRFILMAEGYQLMVRDPVAELSLARAGEVASASFAITNIGRAPATVYGAQSTCSCVATTALPVTVAPGETHTFGVDVHTSDADRGSLVSQRVRLFADGALSSCDLEIRVRVPE